MIVITPNAINQLWFISMFTLVNHINPNIIKKIDAVLTKDTLLKFLSYHEEWNEKDSEFRRVTIDHLINGLQLENVID